MERPPIKDKSVLAYVEYLESKFKSPYYNSYTACKTTIDRWNAQLMKREIDIFDSENKSIFDMAHKFLTEQKPYLEQLEYLSKLITPEEVKEGESRKIKEGSSAEKHIFKDSI